MRVQRFGCGIRGVDRVVSLGRLWEMTPKDAPKDAQRRLPVLQFFERHRLARPCLVETQTTNAALLPEGFIEIPPSCGSGSGEVVDRCTLTLSLTAGKTGEASVLVTVTDAGGQTATGLMTVYVEPPLGTTSGGTSGGGSVGVGILLGLLVLVGFKRKIREIPVSVPRGMIARETVLV